MRRTLRALNRGLENRALTTSLVFLLLAGGVAAAMVAGSDTDEAAAPSTRPTGLPDSSEELRPPPTTAETVPDPIPSAQAERRVPRRFRASSEDVRRLIERNLGASVSSGEPRVTEVRCAGTGCRIRYFASHRGEGRIYGDLIPIFRTLLRDRRLESVDVRVHHEIVGRHKDETLPIRELRCTRAGMRAFVRGEDGRCRVIARTGQDREAPHAKGGGPPPGKGPPENRGSGPPSR